MKEICKLSQLQVNTWVVYMYYKNYVQCKYVLCSMYATEH